MQPGIQSISRVVKMTEQEKIIATGNVKSNLGICAAK
jgi:hypothetical protein